MYSTHLPPIRDAMRADVTVFRRGVMFAVCSIRQATINVPGQLQALFDPQDGDENPLFGHKFGAWEYINDERKCAGLWSALNLLAIQQDSTSLKSLRRTACEGAITALLRVPGLGIVKAAFVAQLMGFDVACLDSRNVTREGRNPRAYRTDGRSPESLAPKVARYVGETYGKAAHYWDAWCGDVAEAYGRTPFEISDLHSVIVPGDFVPF